MRPTLLLLLAAASVSACHTAPLVDVTHSYVETISGVDPKALGVVIASDVVQVWPAARTTILLIPPERSQASNPLTQALISALLNSGFGVTDPDSAPSADAHRLQYWVTALDGEALIRLRLDRQFATRIYAQDAAGHLVPQTPVTMSAD